MNEPLVDYLAMGRRIREGRRALGWTQAQLAERIGVSCAFVGHLERGEKLPSLETVARLSLALNTSLDTLALGRERGDATLYFELARLLERHRAPGA